jgi:primosomal protein N' (replication factor Y)
MARRADRHHAQLLVESGNRGLLQGFLADWVPRISDVPAARTLRWALDVDPLDIF